MKKTKSVKKSLLKYGYYYEWKPFYDDIPENLDVPAYRTEILPMNMTCDEMMREWKFEPYGSAGEAFAAAASCSESLKSGEYRMVFFEDVGIRCRLYVYRSSVGELEVLISKVNPVYQWNAGGGVLFSNGNSDAVTLETLLLEPSDALTDEQAIAHLKNNGYRIYKMQMVDKEF